MAGTIRVRCKICRATGAKDGYSIKKAKDVRCGHKEAVYQGLYHLSKGKIAKTCLSFGLAQDFLNKTYNEISTGTYLKLLPATFGEIADEYLASFRGNVFPSVFSNYGFFIKQLKEKFGHYPMCRVDYKLLSEFVSQQRDKSFSTRQKLQRHLKGIFKLAEFKGVIKSNPASFLKGIRNIRLEDKALVVPPGKIHLLFEATENPLVRLYYKMAAYTGMRPNEIGGLSKSAINLDKREIRIEQTIYWFNSAEERGTNKEPFILQPCKTPAAYRVLPILDELFDDLQIHLITCPENKYNLVFVRWQQDPNEWKQRITPEMADQINNLVKSSVPKYQIAKQLNLNISTIYNWLDREVVQQKRIRPIKHQIDIVQNNFRKDIQNLVRLHEFPPIEFYDIRHTFATILFDMADMNLKDIQYLMGHEDFNTTANLYAKLFGKNIAERGRNQGFAAKMSAYLTTARASQA